MCDICSNRPHLCTACKCCGRRNQYDVTPFCRPVNLIPFCYTIDVLFPLCGALMTARLHENYFKLHPLNQFFK